jgi:hypothetical protein
LYLGSGLTANWKNLFYASGLYLAFNRIPVLLDQRFAIDPYRPSLARLAACEVDLA